MTRQNKTDQQTKKTKKSDLFSILTWTDLEDWAGSRIVARGKNYQREGAVRDLAQTPEGRLVAWVKGSRQYATLVEIDRSGNLDCNCTCPFDGNCKHGVAVILEYLDFQKSRKAVPKAAEDDNRLRIFREEEPIKLDLVREKGGKDNNLVTQKDLETFLKGKSKDDLIKLVLELAERFPPVSNAVSDKIQLSAGRSQPLVDRIRREILEISAEPGWRNYRYHEGHTPDYSDVRDKLKTLLKAGQADDVLSLGKSLMMAGTRQVGMSHDDGATAWEIDSCLPVIVQALDKSSLSKPDKLTWALEAVLEDEYSLFEALAEYLHRKHAAADWNIVADRLLERLRRIKPIGGEDEFYRNYERDQLSNWIIHALEQAGRKEEIIPLCEAETRITGSYERLVRLLLNEGSLAEAEKWIREGLGTVGKKWLGIAGNLRSQLLDIRKREKDWPGAAALLAYEFVASPSELTYTACQKAGEKINLWATIRAGLLGYLEKSDLPWTNSKWPLPSTGLENLERRRGTGFPMFRELIDIAIHEKNPDRVIFWYDKQSKQPHWGWGTGGHDDKIASAVKDKYPDRAVAIWKKMAEREIAQVKPRAYQEAAVFLRKMARLLTDLKRKQEWETYLGKLRETHARKSSLLQVLASLEGKPILKS